MGIGDTYYAGNQQLCPSKQLKQKISQLVEQVQYFDVELHLEFDQVHQILQLVVFLKLLVQNMLGHLVLFF